MAFDRDTYFETNFLHIFIPFALLCILVLATVIYAVVQFVKKAREGYTSRWVYDMICKLLFFAIFMGRLITLHGVALFDNGGIYLPFEQEEDAVRRTGIVEWVESRTGYNDFVRYKIEDEPGTSWGSFVTIDGIRYSVVIWQGVKIGDTVEISCLPKSRCILSYEKVEPQPTEP